MSVSRLFLLGADGLVRKHTEFGNGFGSAPVVWHNLCVKYMKQLFPEGVPKYISSEEWEVLDNTWRKLPLEWWEHNCMLWTMDRVIIAYKDFDLFAKSLTRFYEELSEDYRRSKVCHLMALAGVLAGHPSLKLPGLIGSEPAPLGMAYQHTSVSDNLWRLRVEVEVDGEWYEDERPYDVNKDTGHFFAELMPIPG